VVHSDGKQKRGRVNKSDGIKGEILGTTSDGRESYMVCYAIPAHTSNLSKKKTSPLDLQKSAFS